MEVESRHFKVSPLVLAAHQVVLKILSKIAAGGSYEKTYS